ncbi:MAG: hypothetical protein JNJ54_04550 [Myxococcaceae bacterium]|nr:hypothetical protein [Myxococcaceae bacterium]
MTTAARLNANRENALRSTGPRTSEGRVASSRNATQHGLASELHAVLPHESSEEFDALLADLHGDIQPVGVVEELLCRQVAEASWRVRRAAEYEASVLVAEGADENGVGMAVWRDSQQGKGNVLQVVARYGAAAERSRLSALHELERRQAIRRGAAVAPPAVVEVNVTGAPERIE